MVLLRHVSANDKPARVTFCVHNQRLLNFMKCPCCKLLTYLLVSCATNLAHADVSVKAPWVRATVAQQRATGAFMELASTDALWVVEVRTPAAKIVELHQMLIENNVMKMQALPVLELPPGKAVELKPGGYHIMLVDLVKPLTVGDHIALTLVVEDKDNKRSQIEVNAEVRSISGRPARTTTAGSSDDHAGRHKP
jgi:copper(I)-binding protein